MQNKLQGCSSGFVTSVLKQENAVSLSTKLFSILFLLLVGLFCSLPTSTAHAATAWQDVSAQVSIDVSNPIRSRRSPDAKVRVEITNSGSETLASPLRLVLGGFTPSTLSLQGAAGTTASNDPYLNIPEIAPGSSSGVITLTILGGGRVNFSFNSSVEQEQTEEVILGVDINSPETLITVGSSPLQVSGSVSDPQATLTINGMAVSHSNGLFSAAVAIEEGHNSIVARAVSAAGTEVTDSIVVSMDTTPPYITFESPLNDSTVNTNNIAVSGLINDIVRGTVSEGQANVIVNGIPASVNNRSYLAEDIPLNEGLNEITVSASDQVGNTAHNSIQVTYEPPAPQRIELVSGQSQRTQINEILPNPLSVKLLGSDGVTPVANKSVVFRVIQGDGVLAPGTDNEAQAILSTTNANGVAEGGLKLGTRAGNGNHRVVARAVGFDSEVVFYASADPKAGNKVSVNSGNNQRGAINQPLPHPFIVAVTDEGANVIQDAQIEFKVTQGSGVFQNGSNTINATTDSDGRASAHFTLGEEAGLDLQRVTATLIGTELRAGFTASGLIAGDPGQTKITGVVFDNQDTPLPGVTIRVDGTNRQAVADEQGQFTLTEVPVGPVHLLVDGSTTSVTGEWPTLSYNIVTVAGAVNPLPAPIYMVKLNMATAVMAGREDVELTLPEVPGFKLKVIADSVTFPDGSREGLISVTPVNSSKVPMAPPNGMQPQFIVTIQPAGAVFDPPAPLTLPNVDGHAPGAQVEMYSYDHDLEEFVAIGLGAVSEDGTVVESNIGVGVVKAGWHCGSQPEGSGCTHQCPDCGWCDENCECQPIKIKDGEKITIGGNKKIKPLNDGEAIFKFNAPALEHCDGAVYKWQFGDGEESSDQNPTHTYIEAKEYTVSLEINCDDCSRDLKPASLKVTAFSVEITTPADSEWNISAVPAMPGVEFEAKITPESLLSDATFKWYLEREFIYKTRTDTQRVPASNTKDIQGVKTWTPEWGDGLVGATDVHVYLAVSVDQSDEAKHDASGYKIEGINPSRDAVKTYAGESPWFLPRIIDQESNFRQFISSPGKPLWGTPDGWGLMQLDPPPADQTLWNWQQNINDGTTLLADKGANSGAFWQRQVNQYNQYNQTNGTNIQPHLDIVLNDITFSYSPTGDQKPFSDGLWIKNYNGSSRGYWMTWKNTNLPPNVLPYWQLNDLNSNGHNYVAAICSRNP